MGNVQGTKDLRGRDHSVEDENEFERVCNGGGGRVRVRGGCQGTVLPY